MVNQRATRKARARFALGPSIMAMGTSVLVLSSSAHNPVAKLIIIAGAIFVMIMGITSMVQAIVKTKKAKIGN